MNTRLRIVALPYYEVGKCLGEFFAEASGRVMTLRPDPSNDFDVNAMCAYDWQGRHVGYVSSHDLKDAWQALRGCGRHSLRGYVVDINTEHKCVVLECQVASLVSIDSLYSPTQYLKWEYTGPMLKLSQEMVKLDYMMDEIDDRLYERSDWNDDDLRNFLLLLERYTHESIYDISSETNDYRRRLLTRLRDTKIQALQSLADELDMMGGRTGREASGGCVLHFWTDVITSEEMQKSLMVHQHQYDVKRVENELKLFPDCLYYEWLRDREHFVSKLLYRHIPRDVLWRFVSGIAFVEMVRNAEQAKQARAKKEADKKPVNVIMTGSNASYIENNN